MNRNYLYIFGCIAFTVYGQIILKWRLAQKGHLPNELSEKLIFLAKAFLDPFVLSGFFAAFIASLFWMAAMTKFDISDAYPFTSLAFVLILLLSALFFHEPITLGKVFGMILICAGIIVTAKM
jgi:drug/metabolite transporter (DMT)-like permease